VEKYVDLERVGRREVGLRIAWGNGESFSFWNDPWFKGGLLCF